MLPGASSAMGDAEGGGIDMDAAHVLGVDAGQVRGKDGSVGGALHDVGVVAELSHQRGVCVGCARDSLCHASPTGIDAAGAAFHVVIPSHPGVGLSGRTTPPGWGSRAQPTHTPR